VRFWFTPVDPIGLHCLRVLAGLLFLFWLLPFAGHLEELFGLQGWLDVPALRELARLPDTPLAPISWSVLYLCGGSSMLLTAVYVASLGVLVLFTLGLWPRVTAVLTWVVVLSFMANPATAYDADVLLAVLALYLMIGYLLLGQRGPGRSLAWRLLGPLWPLGGRGEERALWRRESVGANVALRLLQVHFALIMVVSGLHKLQFGVWWSGIAPWFALHRPFESTVQGVRSLAPVAGLYLLALSVATYAGLLWQIGFPLFAWRRRLRFVLLGGAALGWLAMSLVYQLPLFGPAIFLFCLSYLTPAEWHRLGSLLGRITGRVRRRGGQGAAGTGPHARRNATPAKASTI
jgi:hypothetical protein